MKTRVLSIVVLMAMLTGAAETDSVRITPTDKPTVYWQGIRASSVQIPVEVPDYATEAELSITDMAGRVVARQSFSETTTYAWKVFDGDVPAADDIFTLTLVIRNNAKVVKTETATLALVRNAFNPVVLPNKASPGWDRAGDALVLPFSDEWGVAGPLAATLSSQGETEAWTSLAGEGWFGRMLRRTAWSRSVVSLSLGNVSGDAWTAAVQRVADGFTVLFR